jgi:hypothetical protein
LVGAIWCIFGAHLVQFGADMVQLDAEMVQVWGALLFYLLIHVLVQFGA